MRISRDRGLAAYAYTTLDLGVAAAMTRSRDRWARRLAAATLSKGGGAARYAPYAAPTGYRWDYVTDNGVRVTDRGEPVVDLLRAA